MTKIRIVGGPGSGKTYTAKMLSKALHTSYYDLDDLYWDNKANTYGMRMEEKKRNKKLKQLTSKKKWIIEGVYGGEWVKSTFQKANLIIIISPSKTVRTYRIVKRFILRELGLLTSKKETWASFKGLVEWNWQYDENNLRKMKHDIHRFKRKIRVFSSADEAIQYVLG